MSSAESNQHHAARLLTVRQAAASLRMSRSSLYKLIRNNQIEAVKIDRSTRLPSPKIEELVQLLRRLEKKGLLRRA
jgi:excisionase family DNA binding protein